MELRSRALLMGGLALGLAVAVGIYLVLTARPPVAVAQPQTTKVVVTRNDIPDRTVITPANVEQLFELRDVPADVVPARAISNLGSLVGKTVVDKLFKGEVVLDTPDRVVGTGGRNSLSTFIPEGQVAFAIPLPDAAAAGGFTQNGDRVDIAVTMAAKGGATTQIVASDIAVVRSIPGRPQAPGDIASTAANAAGAAGGVAPTVQLSTPSGIVVVLVDRPTATFLENVQNNGGKIVLLLRRFDDKTKAQPERVTPDVLNRRLDLGK